MSIPPVDAELALAEIQSRRAQVVDTNLVPRWFWFSIAALMVAFVAAVESGVTWVVATGTIVYVLGLSALIIAMVRRGQVQVRPELIGVRGGVSIAAFTLALTAIGIGLGFALDALGVPFPATLGCVPVALGLAFGGPALMSHLRRIMLARPLAGN
ncbi:hypothetical protein FB565_008222 [Actinoplanes lutulentus]|uniref:Uncharacterized protein n=1 Tax=Actinoplanes lutulentus TaxID=1287878 RepID=A0A327Z810_9ACTN|nr:hypothetical protein [Actinoplanes lutulentus]MBB2948439.1 hypothetical protein [Actinoplanes lutulentus]RAK34528.1 hypothetical protein B0I29_111127 [Actinoplanes lutulentus]